MQSDRFVIMTSFSMIGHRSPHTFHGFLDGWCLALQCLCIKLVQYKDVSNGSIIIISKAHLVMHW